MEAEVQSQIVAAATSVVVDLLSLFTMVHVSLEEVVAERFDYWARQPLDEWHWSCQVSGVL